MCVVIDERENEREVVRRASSMRRGELGKEKESLAGTSDGWLALRGEKK